MSEQLSSHPPWRAEQRLAGNASPTVDPVHANWSVAVLLWARLFCPLLICQLMLVPFPYYVLTSSLHGVSLLMQ